MSLSTRDINFGGGDCGRRRRVRSPAGGPTRSPPIPTCHCAISLQQTRRCSFFLASARTKQLETSSNATKKIAVVVCQRHSHTRTRAELVSKHYRSSLLEASLAWCTVRSHNSDPTSSGQTVATVNHNCCELFSIARFLRARERVRYASAPLREDHTSVRGPQTENPPRARALNCLSRLEFASSWRHTSTSIYYNIVHPFSLGFFS